MRLRLIGSAVLVLACAVPSAALAGRPATAAEAKAIAAAVHAFVSNPSNHAASDNTVAKASVSSDGKYAAAQLKSVSGNSTSLLKRSASSWKVIGFAATQPCNLAPAADEKDLGFVNGKTCGAKG